MSAVVDESSASAAAGALLDRDDVIETPTAPPTARTGAYLGVGRAAEQGAYGIAMLVLAARMGPSSYGPVAAVFLANSIALTLADLGVAHDLLRWAAGRAYPRRTVQLQRGINLAVGLVGVVVGSIVGGSVGLVILFSGLLWAIGGETYVRQAVALRGGRIRAHVVADVVSAIVLVAAVVVWGRDGHGLLVCGVALVVHHLLVVVCLPIPRGSIDGPGVGRPAGFLANHTLAFFTRNTDYVLVGPLLGPTAFANYVLGFRVASAPSAPLGAVVLRWGLARLASEDEQSRDATNRRALLVLSAVGVLGAIVTIAIGFLLPHVIGEQWKGAAAVAVVLAWTLPWRFLEGMIEALGFTINAGALMVRFEAVRLGGTALTLVLGAWVGAGGFVAAVVFAAIVSVTVGHLIVSKVAGLRPSYWIVAAAPVAIVAATILSHVLVNPVLTGG
jgi:PST family polysaccharide transporter